MIITLKFDEDEITQLWTTTHKNFIKEQHGRFELFKADEGYDGLTGEIFFFEDFLNLKIFQSFMNEKGFVSAIWSEVDINDGAWCLAIARRKERRKPKD